MEHLHSCSCCPLHENAVHTALENMPDDKELDALSAFFKMMGDPTRIKMMCVMAQGEMCVQDIASALDMTKSAISHQLRTLKQARLVKARRNGKNTFYSLDDEHIKRIIEQVMIHIEEE